MKQGNVVNSLHRARMFFGAQSCLFVLYSDNQGILNDDKMRGYFALNHGGRFRGISRISNTNSTAERSVRIATGGIMCCMHQSGPPDKQWHLACDACSFYHAHSLNLMSRFRGARVAPYGCAG